MFRLFIPVIPVIIAACGQTPAANDNTQQQKDTTVTTTGDSATDNMITSAEQQDGWQLLFDGSSKANWHIYNNKKDGSAWNVEDGSLTLDPAMITTGGGDLVSDGEYGNFHFKIDWKVDTAANSGLIFFVNEDKKYPESYHTGLEMQVLDNERHSDAKIPKHRAGDLYDLIALSPESVKPAGEWNTAEIISNNGSLELRLNGTGTAKTTLWDDNWKKMVAASKFREWPDFGTYKTGHIVLQDHGDRVWYRNIRIKKL